ncbi:hypothetical protein B0G80_8771 [Paraburkholderia sp. BL6669N2]|uniref:hypothetical protein n=1 Tax=Paraburkholderia sp. BL6669N2 TaxID=1938807 RepID=UPI000E26629C|nr:hypothetical protein [Paraburkholderia sp. BL6669N2]REG52229.1 hypothetical protein B0G80_8771 [Paraburkholderia sp. BL6669N2]
MYDNHGTALGIKGGLATAILEPCEANPDRTAYVVPRSEILDESERSPTRSTGRFVVIALPDIPSGEIDCSAQQIRVEVRTRPDGTDTECVVLADGTVAISGQIIQAAGADMNGQFLIAWMFADSLEFTEYMLLDTNIQDLQAAQQIAQSNAHAGLRQTAEARGTSKQVIEVFEHTVVAVEPSR